MKISLAILLGAALMARAEDAQDPSKDGPHPVAWRKVAVPDTKADATLEGALFYPGAEAKQDAAPAAGGPWPACVFSPGGPASDWRWVEDFGKRFASWGVATLVVTFGDRQAPERAKQMLASRDWLEKQNADKEWFLAGKLDAKVFLAGGHSRGGAAAILAAADSKKWAGCVTVGAALAKIPADYATPTYLIGAAEDKTLPALYDGQKKPRWLAVVAGMDHFMNPDAKRSVVLAYCTAWVGARFLKVGAFEAWLSGDRGAKDLKEGVLSEWKSGE